MFLTVTSPSPQFTAGTVLCLWDSSLASFLSSPLPQPLPLNADVAALARAGDRLLILLWCTPLRGLKGASEPPQRASSRPGSSQGHHPPPRSPGNRGASPGQGQSVGFFSCAVATAIQSLSELVGRRRDRGADVSRLEHSSPGAPQPRRIPAPEHLHSGGSSPPGTNPRRAAFRIGAFPTWSILRRGRYAVPGATPHPLFRQPFPACC